MTDGSPTVGATALAAGHVAGATDFQRVFGVSRETTERLTTYAELLVRWQHTINLVAPSTLRDVWHRHFADSAQVWSHRPPSALTWLDLGSGAGFPGLVLAIMASDPLIGQPGTRHFLIESDSRKAAFLREVARSVGVAVDILCMRIESSETLAKVNSVDCVTARALAPLPRLISWASPFLAPESVCLFLKGRDAAAELDEAARIWSFDVQSLPSVTDPGGRVVLLKALKAKTEG
jgi:16S rRNA (guanine527-N7)-methyltransferase